MKVQFELDSRDDDYEFECIINAQKYRSILSALRDEMRTEYKHGSDERKNTLEYWYERLFELANENNLDAWEI